MKKSTTTAAVLGFFGFGLFYVFGFKKGLLYFLAYGAIISTLSALISPTVSSILPFGCAFFCYKAAADFNASLPDTAHSDMEN